MDFAEDPSLIIRNRVILDRGMSETLSQSVYDFDLIEFEDDTTACSALNQS